jgi:hypothetical protein
MNPEFANRVRRNTADTATLCQTTATFANGHQLSMERATFAWGYRRILLMANIIDAANRRRYQS